MKCTSPRQHLLTNDFNQRGILRITVGSVVEPGGSGAANCRRLHPTCWAPRLPWSRARTVIYALRVSWWKQPHCYSGSRQTSPTRDKFLPLRFAGQGFSRWPHLPIPINLLISTKWSVTLTSVFSQAVFAFSIAFVRECPVILIDIHPCEC